jgi:hypothetical protein
MDDEQADEQAHDVSCCRSVVSILHEVRYVPLFVSRATYLCNHNGSPYHAGQPKLSGRDTRNLACKDISTLQSYIVICTDQGC